MRKIMVVFLLSVCFMYCDVTKETKEITVAASILPLSDFARHIGGDRVNVITIIPPGMNPHIFELTPSLMQKLSTSDLIILNNIGLEPWSMQNFQEFGIPIIDTSRGIEIIKGESDAHETHGNPHVWLNPQNALIQVDNILKGFLEIDSQNADLYTKNATLFKKQLIQLDTIIRKEIETWEKTQYICFHPAWTYFADEYGLEQAAVIQERPGQEPTPGELASVIETIREIDASAVFADPQIHSSALQMLVEETGVEIIYLDPLGSAEKTAGYMELMKVNLDKMASALK